MHAKQASFCNDGVEAKIFVDGVQAATGPPLPIRRGLFTAGSGSHTEDTLVPYSTTLHSVSISKTAAGNCDGSHVTPADAQLAPLVPTSTAVRAAAQPIRSQLVFNCAGYEGTVTYECSPSGDFERLGPKVCSDNPSLTCDASAIAVPHGASGAFYGTATREEGQIHGSTLVFPCAAGFDGGPITFTCITGLTRGAFEASGSCTACRSPSDGFFNAEAGGTCALCYTCDAASTVEISQCTQGANRDCTCAA